MTSTVPFNDIGRIYSERRSEYDEAALGCLESGWYVLGPSLERFESEFADYIGMRHGIGVNSGQDSLILALRALGIGEGDEVIVQSNAYIASVFGITENGATPVFVEPDEFFGLDPKRIEERITDRTKAIMVVHLYGQPCDMGPIARIARERGLWLIEDCAQCHGSSYDGKKAGSFGDVSCFSFYPTKPLGAFGDGGMCLTNDDDLAERLRMLRYYGSREKYVSEIEGCNSRLDEMQAALLGVKLRHLDEDNEARRRSAGIYLDEIRNPLVTLPEVRPGSTHVFHLFPILVERRDELRSHLSSLGIQTGIHYPIPPHLQRCFERLGLPPGSFPIAERYADQELSLPIFTGITDEEVRAVVSAINDFSVD